jgi:thioredoxin reductase
MADKIYDVTIVGGGPVGLFTAFYGGMRQCSVKIIDSMPQLGGQLTALYPEKFIYDVAGFPQVRAQELVDNLEKQLNQFQTTIALEEQVLKVEKLADDNFLITTNKAIHYSRTIIITGGAGAFQPRKLEHELAENFEGKNLHYFIKDLNSFKDKKVVVIGGGDSAVDWALMLEPIAKEVHLVHRRDKFRAHESSVEKLKNSSVNVLTPYNTKDLICNETIDRIVLGRIKSEEEITLDVDEVIVNFGFVSSLGPIKEWGLELEKGSIIVNTKMETNIPGIYAAGDITTYPGKVKLIAVGFGEGPTAINNAKSYIDPNARVQPGHSTSMDFGQLGADKVKLGV